MGPAKLGYAWKVAENLLQNRMAGSAVFFCPGKSYPGEVNPRWVVRIIANRDGMPLFRLPKHTEPLKQDAVRQLAEGIRGRLALPARWVQFLDPTNAGAEILAMPIDYDDDRLEFIALVAPQGCPCPSRKPKVLPVCVFRSTSCLFSVPRRALSIERNGDLIAIFIPPLLQKPFLKLLSAIEDSASRNAIGQVALQGYTPADEAGSWTSLGLAADPGVLEVNLPACSSWHEYATGLKRSHRAAKRRVLRSWKEASWEHPKGTGGGNHLLWVDRNWRPTRFSHNPPGSRRFSVSGNTILHSPICLPVPTWAHPRKPRVRRKSARDLYDIEMAYRFLESLPPGDHRELINETLRHLQTDVTGNSHRSELSFDKFWNTAWPSGALGLIEFRAIESLPRGLDVQCRPARTCLAAHLLESGVPQPQALRQKAAR